MLQSDVPRRPQLVRHDDLLLRVALNNANLSGKSTSAADRRRLCAVRRQSTWPMCSRFCMSAVAEYAAGRVVLRSHCCTDARLPAAAGAAQGEDAKHSLKNVRKPIASIRKMDALVFAIQHNSIRVQPVTFVARRSAPRLCTSAARRPQHPSAPTATRHASIIRAIL